MLKSYQNGDVDIKEATLTSSATRARISILPQLQGFDIFEDMGKPTLYAELYMFDSIGLLSDFPIVGEEDVTISFETPGHAQSVTYRFKVFKVMNVQHSENRQAVGYTLACVSAEHYSNAIDIKSSFEGTLSDLATYVVRNHLMSKKILVLEESKGVHQLVIPSWSPLQALDYARKNSVSRVHPSSSYTFFENQSGFTFASVEYLLAQGDVGTRTFTFPLGGAQPELKDSFRTVIEHEALGRSDALESIQSGAMSAETQTFDLLTKQLSTQKFSIAEQFGKFTTPDERSRLAHSASFVRDHPEPQRFFIVKDSARPATYAEDALAPRNSYRQMLNSNCTRLLVHGDSGLKAGDMISLELPTISGTTGKKDLDPLLAGNYIVLRLRHIIESGAKAHHECSLDVAKVGLRR